MSDDRNVHNDLPDEEIKEEAQKSAPQDERDSSSILSSNAEREEEKVDKATPRVRRLMMIGIAAVAVVILAVGGWYISTLVPEEEEVAVAEPTTLTDRTVDDITKILIEGSNGTILTVVPDEDSTKGDWTIEEMHGQQLEQQRLISLKRNLANLVTEDTVATDVTDFDQFGLATPQSLVTVYFSDGEEFQIELGNNLVTSTRYYCKVPGGDTVYILANITGYLFEAKPTNFRDLSVFSVSGTSGKLLNIQHRGEDLVTLKAQYNQAGATYSTWVFESPYSMEADGTLVSEFIEQVASIYPSSMVALDADLADYGLDDPTLILEYVDANNNRFYMEFGDYNAEGTHIYVRVSPDNNEIFQVYGEVATFAFDSTANLLNWFTNLVTFSATDTIEITSGSKTFTMRLERFEQFDENGEVILMPSGDVDYEQHAYVNDKEVDLEAYRKTFQDIVGITMNGAVEETRVNPDDTPVLKIEYTLNKSPYTLHVEYLPYDVEHYSVRREGEIGFFVRRGGVDAIIPSLEALYAADYDPNAVEE